MPKIGSINIGVSVDLKKFNRALKKMEWQLTKASRSMRSMGKSLTAGLTVPLGLVGISAVKAAADFETLETSLKVMTKSAKEAKRVMADLQAFSASTPFQFEDIGRAAAKIIAATGSTKNLNAQLRALGDISAGVNQNLGDITDIYIKVLGKGKLQAEEINQFAEKGIPLTASLAKVMGVAESSVRDLASAGKVTSGVFIDALIDMTGEGGLFQKAMEEQSKTIAGKWSTMVDNIKLAWASFGQALNKNTHLKDILDKITTVAKKIKVIITEMSAETQIKLLKMLGAVALAGPALMVMSVGFFAASKAVKALRTSLGLAQKALTILLSPAGLVISIFGALALAIGFLADGDGPIQKVIFAWKTMQQVMLGLGKVMLKPAEWIIKGIEKMVEGIQWGFNLVLKAYNAMPKFMRPFKLEPLDMTAFTKSALDGIASVQADIDSAIMELEAEKAPKELEKTANKIKEKLKDLGGVFKDGLGIGLPKDLTEIIGKFEELDVTSDDVSMSLKELKEGLIAHRDSLKTGGDETDKHKKKTRDWSEEIRNANSAVERAILLQEKFRHELSKTETLAEKTADNVGDAWDSAIDGMIRGTANFGEIITEMFNDIASDIIKNSLNPLKQSITSTIGGLIGGLDITNASGSGALDKAAQDIINFQVPNFRGIGGFFADGGKPPVGKVSVVGERGPELFVPNQAGTIIPNHELGGFVGVKILQPVFIGVQDQIERQISARTPGIIAQALAAVEAKSLEGGSFARNLRGEV